ncbi:glycosyltransferase family 9 protein [Pseudoalteromonas sp. SSM20]|uniref:glycosyltransferase family 9 protein n=1 Tax=Pseudoalteromonas sp. SSM20 TaxID=3139394 RepID=UPI003BAD7756
MHYTKQLTNLNTHTPEITLTKESKVLYMTHLALGDYVYQGAFLKALADTYPGVQIDVWMDDCRSHQKSWHSGRNATLQQWLTKESHLNAIYPIAHSEQHRNELISKASKEQYDVIVFVATTRAPAYLKVAKAINPNAQVAGTTPKDTLSRLLYRSQFKALNVAIDSNVLSKCQHISDFYNHVFSRLFAVSLDDQLRSREITPNDTLNEKSKQQIALWRNQLGLSQGNTLFINHISTNEKRDWQNTQLAEFAHQLTKQAPNTLFVLNTPPHKLDEVTAWCAEQKDIAVIAFSATDDFFELPSMMLACDLVVSVETAIMHLASCLSLPQVALIRKSASNWRPLQASKVLTGKKRVDNIAVSEVVKAASQLL